MRRQLLGIIAIFVAACSTFAIAQSRNGARQPRVTITQPKPAAPGSAPAVRPEAGQPVSPRELPADRSDFRGEHAGVIYTRSGWRELNVDPELVGPNFFAPHGYGPSVYVPYYANDVVNAPAPILGATYEVVYPKEVVIDEAPQAGRYELRATEVVIPGEYVEVFQPAVYELDESGVEQLVEREATVTVPKVKIVLKKVWVPGKEK